MSREGLVPLELFLVESSPHLPTRRVKLGEAWTLEHVGGAYLLRSATRAVELPASSVRSIEYGVVPPLQPRPESVTRPAQPQMRGKRA